MSDKELKKFRGKLRREWEKIEFNPNDSHPRSPEAIVVERTLIGDVNCTTNTMGSIDNSVLERIAAVSR